MSVIRWTFRILLLPGALIAWYVIAAINLGQYAFKVWRLLDEEMRK